MATLPTVGRMVHYVSYGTPIREDGKQAYQSECRAAVVTQVRESTVGLAVMNPTGMFFHVEVPFDEGVDPAMNRDLAIRDPRQPLCNGRVFDGGSWHWPQRES